MPRTFNSVREALVRIIVKLVKDVGILHLEIECHFLAALVHGDAIVLHVGGGRRQRVELSLNLVDGQVSSLQRIYELDFHALRLFLLVVGGDECDIDGKPRFALVAANHILQLANIFVEISRSQHVVILDLEHYLGVCPVQVSIIFSPEEVLVL